VSGNFGSGDPMLWELRGERVLGSPMMPIVNRYYLKLVLLYVYVNSTWLSIVKILATALEYPNHARPKTEIVPPCSAQRW